MILTKLNRVKRINPFKVSFQAMRSNYYQSLADFYSLSNLEISFSKMATMAGLGSVTLVAGL